MRRTAKTKPDVRRTVARKPAMSASAAARRSFPAWIDAGEPGVAFTATRAATPRVRAGLVLRAVRKKTGKRRGLHGPSAR